MGIKFFTDGRLTSGIKERWGKMHNGLDYAVPIGTDIQSVTGGTVVYTGNDPNGYGNYIKVRDTLGNTHIYGHLSKIQTAPGETVEAGEVIGLSGNTGKSTGPHVHYEVRDTNNNVLNGLSFLQGARDVQLKESNSNVNTTFLNSDSESEELNGFGKKLTLFAFLLLLVIGCIFFIFKTFDVSVVETGVNLVTKGATKKMKKATKGVSKVAEEVEVTDILK